MNSLVARLARAYELGLPEPKAAKQKLVEIFKRTPMKRHRCPGCGVGGHSRNGDVEPVLGGARRGGARVG